MSVLQDLADDIQQEETRGAAHVVREEVQRCTFAVVVTFVPRLTGGVHVECSGSGGGPSGFSSTVRTALTAAAETIARQVELAEAEPGSVSTVSSGREVYRRVRETPT
jgi:hypothetical protein